MQARLRRWIVRLCVPLQDVGDLAQDTTTKALGSLHTFDPRRGSLARWFNRIAVHECAHHRARARHRREELTPDPPEEIDDDALQADVLIEAEEARIAVIAALMALPELARAIILEHDLEGAAMAEIAARREVALSTAYKHRARGLAALGRLLRPVWEAEADAPSGSGRHR